MSHRATRLLGVAIVWIVLSGASTTDRNARMSELVYTARKLGADYETVMKLCKGNWVCQQVAIDAYDQPNPTPYIKPEKEATCYRSSDQSCLPSPRSADSG